jgi:hypothetical protein
VRLTIASWFSQVVANHAEMMEKLNQFNVIQNSNSLLRSDVEVKAKQLSEKEEELKYGAYAFLYCLFHISFLAASNITRTASLINIE